MVLLLSVAIARPSVGRSGGSVESLSVVDDSVEGAGVRGECERERLLRASNWRRQAGDTSLQCLSPVSRIKSHDPDTIRLT